MLSRLLKKLRGALGIGTTWGVTGGVLGGLISGAVTFFTSMPLLTALSIWALGMALVGFLLGTGFGVFLALFEGRRTLAELTPWRAARWGGLAGAALPVGWFLLGLTRPETAMPLSSALLVVLAAGATYGALTATLAAGTVWIAKRAPDELTSADLPDEGRMVEGPEGDS